MCAKLESCVLRANIHCIKFCASEGHELKSFVLKCRLIEQLHSCCTINIEYPELSFNTHPQGFSMLILVFFTIGSVTVISKVCL